MILAKWFEDKYPSPAASLREGLDEMFTIHELRLPTTLRRSACLDAMEKEWEVDDG